MFNLLINYTEDTPSVSAFPQFKISFLKTNKKPIKNVLLKYVIRQQIYLNFSFTK